MKSILVGEFQQNFKLLRINNTFDNVYIRHVFKEMFLGKSLIKFFFTKYYKSLFSNNFKVLLAFLIL